ncbi:LOW QUALITY PROTEIN: hypothetical protein SETIT_6G020700v2 [Setaria italica]|uniref:MATH domain-containing protein n=2 Tax=Setaria italica TaxID=4555 RepID=A0A368RHI7_SETIT|nr:LOW QUALITY PROTEIN: hypothetical protein SETIT_6G020700v2 [Setaria italica]
MAVVARRRLGLARCSCTHHGASVEASSYAAAADSTAPTSTCTVESAQGTHLFHIAGYNLHEHLRAGTSICSDPFSVGGYDWAVQLLLPRREGGALVLLLKLLTKNAAARASCAFRFHNPATGAASARWSVPLLHYRSGLVNKRAQVSTFRWNVLMYAHDDRLTVECAVTVVHEPKVSETKAVFAVEEPPSEQSEHLGRILEEEGCDVTFDVQGEVFTAPKIVLGMRSPVFKEKFYGPEMEKG